MVANSAIILAAGASERLGTHKALVEVGNQTLIESVFNRLEQANLEVTIVTRGSLADSIRTLLPEANVIVNPNPEQGRTGTIQCGINEIGIGPVLIARWTGPDSVSARAICFVEWKPPRLQSTMEGVGTQLH